MTELTNVFVNITDCSSVKINLLCTTLKITLRETYFFIFIHLHFELKRYSYLKWNHFNVPLRPFQYLVTKHVWDKCIFPFSIKRDVPTNSMTNHLRQKQFVFTFTTISTNLKTSSYKFTFCQFYSGDNKLEYKLQFCVVSPTRHKSWRKYDLNKSLTFCSIFLKSQILLQNVLKIQKYFFSCLPERVFTRTKNIRFLHWAISKHISQQTNWIITIFNFYFNSNSISNQNSQQSSS